MMASARPSAAVDTVNRPNGGDRVSLFVTFYGDGPYWDNLVMLPAYPTGYTYLRPFRYRDVWVDPDLAERAANAPASFVGEAATLGIRFTTDGFGNVLIPIRQVQIATVAREQDNFVYFSLGRFVDVSGAQKLGDIARAVPPEVDAVDAKLFFEAEIADSVIADASRDVQMWSRLTDLIASETEFPISSEAKRSLFFHFQTPTRTKPAAVGEIESSFTHGSRFGASLPEASAHELVVLHRVPHLIGSGGSIPTVDAVVSGANFDPAPARLSLSGNYNRSVVTVIGRRPSAGWQELDIQPTSSNTRTAGGEQINLVGLSIPVKVTKSLVYRAKTRWIPLSMLVAALFVNGLVGAWSVVGEHPGLWVVVGLAAIIASGAVLQIQRD